MRRFSVRFRAWLVALALVDAQLGVACATCASLLVLRSCAIRLACSYAARLGSSAACSGFFFRVHKPATSAQCTCALVDAQLVLRLEKSVDIHPELV
jgi:hypothetical protein